MSDFNPNDHNVMLQRLLSHAESHGEQLRDIRIGQSGLVSRVSELEHEKWYNRGVVAAVGLLAAGVWEWARQRF